MQQDIKTKIQSVREGHDNTAFIGHPKGLGFIVFTEAWERFSFYGMQALLVLYMATHLFLPEASGNVAGFESMKSVLESVFGPMSTQALASQTFGLYVGLVYFSPVFGGYLGDRYIGKRLAVLSGAVLMAIGHFLMAFEASFFLALLFLILGSGLLKGNLAAQVGQLYEDTDQRRDAGYSIYTFSINVGAFIAPLICGTLGELYGWHYGFGAAGIGMLVGIAIYAWGQKFLPPDNRIGADEEQLKISKEDFPAIVAIVIVLGITSLYWTTQTQVWNAYPLWIRAEVDRSILGLDVPVTWFQSLDSLTVLVLAPAVLWYWRIQNKKGVEPEDLSKIMIGCLIFGAAFLLLSIGEFIAGAGGVSLMWPILFHFVCGVGFLYIGPVALAFTSRVAPASVNSMMVGSYYLAIFIGGFGSGWLGQFYENMSAEWFWTMHAAIVSAGAILILLIRPFLSGVIKASKR